MADNYCGRSCEGCELQTELSCKGCKNGPGGELNACELASCCESKMLISCNDCTAKDECEKVQSHKTIPDYIRNSLSGERGKIKRIKERARLAADFRMLFILNIISIVTSFVTGSTFAESIQILANIGSFLSLACSVMMIVTYFKLGNVVDDYRTYAICNIVSIVGGVVLGVLAVIYIFISNPIVLVLTVTIGIAVVAIGFFGMYKEFCGHSEILSGIDDEFAEKWDVLWRWFIYSFGGMIIGLLLMLISVLLGAIIILAGAIVLLVVGIRRLIYLKKMYDLFDELELKYKDVIIED